MERNLMTKLYEITNQFIGLQSLIDEGELDPEILQDTLDGLEMDLQAKAEGLLAFVSNIGSDVDSVTTEIKRLQDRKKGMQNKQTSLREYLKFNMQSAEISKITCPLFSITLTKPRPMVVITNAEGLPDNFIKTTVTKAPIKADILKALKAGETVSGAELGHSEPGLMIR
jgi:hypothetical protein